MLSQHFLQIGKLMHLLTVNTDDNVIRLQHTGSRTAFYNFGNQDTFLHTEFVGFLLHFLSQSFVHLQVCAQCSTGNTQQSTLYRTELLQVRYNFRHDAGGDCKAVAGVCTCRWIQHGVDTYQLTSCINQRTATVALIDGSIRLDERLDIRSLSVGSRCADGTSLCTNDTGCYGRVQVERVTYRQHPLTYFQFVGVAYRYCGEIVTLNLNQRKVGAGVSTNDAAFQFAVIVQFHGNFISTLNHVVVGYDIAVFGNNHAGTETYARLGLYLTLLSATVTEEEVKNIRHALHCLSLAQLFGTYMYYGMNRTFCRLRQVNRLRIRRVISSQP